MNIYAVGVLDINEKYDANKVGSKRIKDQRLWYVVSSFEEAERIVLQNEGDIFEYYYNHAIIEEIFVVGSIPNKYDAWSIPKQWWYKASYSNNEDVAPNPVVTRIDPPDWAEHICNFWVG